MKGKIISLLKENGGYVSGEKISEELGITRSAVWKHINSLKEEGCIIDSVRNKGYRLISEPDNLDEKKIRGLLNVAMIGRDLITMKSVDSTNEEAKRLAHEGAPHGLVIASDRQTAGKGRFSFMAKSELLPWEGTGCWSPVFPAQYADVAHAAAVCVKALDAFVASGGGVEVARLFEFLYDETGFPSGMRSVEL